VSIKISARTSQEGILEPLADTTERRHRTTDNVPDIPRQIGIYAVSRAGQIGWTGFREARPDGVERGRHLGWLPQRPPRSRSDLLPLALQVDAPGANGVSAVLIAHLGSSWFGLAGC
jgi:hypothetical protein